MEGKVKRTLCSSVFSNINPEHDKKGRAGVALFTIKILSRAHFMKTECEF